MRVLWCVNDGVPPETTDLLADACRRLGVGYEELQASEFDFSIPRNVNRGDMLYRPSGSYMACWVEQFLFAPGVATFNSQPNGVFFECTGAPLVFQSKGLPIAPNFPIASPKRDRLRHQVEALGGFPVVIKALGGSNGVGTMRVESYPALFSLVDFMLENGHLVQMCRYLGDSTHWRVVVVGAAAVAAYSNPRAPDDFRTYPGDDPTAYTADVPEALGGLAVAAVQASGLEFGGVDILATNDGSLFLLEVNYPCYFADAQLIGGLDVAGAMVRHLLSKHDGR